MEMVGYVLLGLTSRLLLSRGLLLIRGTICRFRMSREDAMKAAAAHRRQPIWEIWSIVLGEPPPVPNVRTWGLNVPAEEGLIALVEAHACFRGICRALAEDDNGENVVAYILKPRFFYEYRANLVSTAVKLTVPAGLLFAVYVRIDIPWDAQRKGTVGVVTHGGFVEADPSDPLLPEDHASRYTQRLW